MDIIELLKTIKEDWALLVFVFGIGAAWIQGKTWFKKLTDTLESVNNHNNIHKDSLANINNKLESLDKKIARIEGSIEIIQQENHVQAVKIAVLESNNVVNISPKRTRLRRQQ